MGTKISSLPSAGTLTGTEIVVMDQAGNTVTALSGNMGIWVRTAAETAAGVTPTNYGYSPGNALRYNADSTGATDSSTAVSNCLKANGFCYLPGLGGTAVYAMNVTLAGQGLKIFGDSSYTTTVKNFANSAVFTLDATSANVLRCEISHLQIANANAAADTAADGIVIQGDAGGANQNDFHTFRDLLIYEMRYGINVTGRSVWNVLEKVTINTPLADAMIVQSNLNNDMWSFNQCRFANAPGHGFHFTSSFATLCDSWSMIECDFENNSLCGVYLTGTSGVQGWKLSNCHWESNTGGIAHAATNPPKANVFVNAAYAFGLEFDACTFYGGTTPEPDYNIYIDTPGNSGSATANVCGDVWNCRFQNSSQTVVNDVYWPKNCLLGLNQYGQANSIDPTQGSIDLSQLVNVQAFTPTISIGGSSVGVTYLSQVGRYQQVGNLVTFELYVSLSSTGGLAGAVAVNGLPVASSNVGNLMATPAIAADQTALPSDAGVSARIAPNTSAIIPYKIAAGVLTQLVNTDIGNSTAFSISGSYFTR